MNKRNIIQMYFLTNKNLKRKVLLQKVITSFYSIRLAFLKLLNISFLFKKVL